MFDYLARIRQVLTLREVEQLLATSITIDRRGICPSARHLSFHAGDINCETLSFIPSNLFLKNSKEK